MRPTQKPDLTSDLARLGLSRSDIDSLRRYAGILHRWYEEECGDSNDRMSWAIERDEATKLAYRVFYPHVGQSYRALIRDRESSSRRGIERIAKAQDLHVYYQTDPRGAPIYLSREPMTDSDYTRGVPVVPARR